MRGERRNMKKKRFYDPFQAINSIDVGENTTPYLLLGNNEKAFINANPFVIGKDNSQCNLVIASRAVSRRHGEIFFENAKYYFADNNSTNGTYINGARIEKGQKVAINSRDVIRVADVDIKFFC